MVSNFQPLIKDALPLGNLQVGSLNLGKTTFGQFQYACRPIKQCVVL